MMRSLATRRGLKYEHLLAANRLLDLDVSPSERRISTGWSRSPRMDATVAASLVDVPEIVSSREGRPRAWEKMLALCSVPHNNKK